MAVVEADRLRADAALEGLSCCPWALLVAVEEVWDVMKILDLVLAAASPEYCYYPPQLFDSVKVVLRVPVVVFGSQHCSCLPREWVDAGGVPEKTWR